MIESLKRLRHPSDPLLLGLSAAVSAVLLVLGQLSGQLDDLGIHTLWAKLGAGTCIALLTVLQRIYARHAYLQRLLVAKLKPLMELRPNDFGAAISGLGARHLRDDADQYVQRDRDDELRERLLADPFVLLLGPSGSGKSFTAHRLAREVHGDRYALIPPPPAADATDPTRRDPLSELLTLPPPAFRGRRRGWVLWLDDFGEHLANGDVDQVALRRWLKGHPRRRIVATLDSEDRGQEEGAAGIRQRVREMGGYVSLHTMELEWSPSEQSRVRDAYDDVTPDAARAFSHYCACSRLLNEYADAAGRNDPGIAVVRAAIDWHHAGMTRPIPRRMLRDLLPLYLPERLTRRALDSRLKQGLAWATRKFDAPAAFLTEVESSPTSYKMHHVAFDAVRKPPESGVWVTLDKRLRNPAERVAMARAALVRWDRSDVAKAVLKAAMEDPGELRREIDQLWEQLPPDEGPEREDMRRLAGERVSSGLTASQPGVPPPLRQRTPVRWLAAINRTAILKAIVRVTTLLLIDFACLGISLLLAWALLDALSGSDLGAPWTATLDRIPYVMLLVLLLFTRGGLYRPQIRRAHFARVIAALTQAALAFAVLDTLADADVGPGLVIPIALALAIVFIGCGRLLHMRATRWLRMRALGHVPRQALIGWRRDVRRVKDHLSGPRRGRELMGWIAVRGDRRDVEGLRCLGQVDELRTLIDAHGLDDLVVCSDAIDEDSLTEIARAAWLTHTHVRAIAGGRRFLVRASRYAPGEALPLEQLQLPEFEPTEYAIKRAFDLFLSATLLVLTTPLWIVAVIVRVGTRKPVLDTRRQPGRGGRHFVVRKFRTTRLGRPEMRPGRPTKIGPILDKAGIDELPQLWSVLTGKMSLVGPRPISQLDYDCLEHWQRRRSFVPPGITGLWQISGRQDEEYDDMVRLDLDYVQHWSLFLDIEILLKSVQVAIKGPRATLRTNTGAVEL